MQRRVNPSDGFSQLERNEKKKFPTPIEKRATSRYCHSPYCER